ncbi:MAG: hypothetical protein ACLGG6_02160 [Gammaproteobacteria bacterium]
MKRLVLPAALLLAACDPTPPPQPEVEREPNPVFESQIRAIEKARDTGAVLQESEDARRRQLEEAAH